jgi:DNA polymerase-3 subunit epsilon
MRLIVLDTETTGLKPEEGHRLIEVAGVEIIDRRITGEAFHRYVNPQRTIDQGATQVHGLSAERLQHEPLFADIAEEFLAFIGNDPLVIHNAPFDLGFLNCELALAGLSQRLGPESREIIDTLMMARQRHPGARNTLDALLARYHIDSTSRALHGARIDAELLARLYLVMTGGQTAMGLDAPARQAARTRQAVQRSPHRLVVCTPSPEERCAHEAILQTLRDGGQCLWPPEDSTSNNEVLS